MDTKEIVLLIDLVKNFPELYIKKNGPNSNPAKDLKARENAWEQIAEQINVDVKVLKAKWKTLRDSFNRCLKRARQVEDDNVAISWPFFEKMLFLKDHTDQGSRSAVRNSSVFQESSIKYENEDDDEQNDDSQIEDYEHNLMVENVNETEQWNDEINENMSDTEPEKDEKDESLMDDFLVLNKNKKRKQKLRETVEERKKRRILEEESDKFDEKITNCLNIFKEKLEKKKDGIDAFCEFIGSFIRQWPPEEQCLSIKYLTDYVMEKHLTFVDNA